MMTMRAGCRAIMLFSAILCELFAFALSEAASEGGTQGEEYTDLTNDNHMKTSFFLTKDGKLTASTRTWTDSNLWGFTGGVVIRLGDADGNPLWQSQLHKFGVNGRWIITASSDRWDQWSEQVPLDVMEHVANYDIKQMHTPTSRVGDFVDKVLKPLAGWVIGNAG